MRGIGRARRMQLHREDPDFLGDKGSESGLIAQYEIFDERMRAELCVADEGVPSLS